MSSVGNTRRTVVIVILVVLATPVVVFGSLIAFVSFELSRHPLFSDTREHLKPIPMSAVVCPYVLAMHEAANRFQAVEQRAAVGRDAHLRPARWSSLRPRVDEALNSLGFAVAASAPHFPEPVQQQFAIVSGDIRKGRVELAATHDAVDLSTGTGSLFEEGQTAFGFAGDLIGHRCKVQLGADNDAPFLPLQFLPTTTTTRVGSSTSSTPGGRTE